MEEMLDVFDINGNYLGVKSRSFCHSENPGVYHKPVWIWIKNDQGQVLVQKRAMCKKQWPGLWDMPAAGHVDAGEDLITACVRETEEELGIHFEKDDFKFIKEWYMPDEWELGQIYLLNTNAKIEDMTLQVEEVEEVKWLDYQDFKEMFYSPEFCTYDEDYRSFVLELLK